MICGGLYVVKVIVVLGDGYKCFKFKMRFVVVWIFLLVRMPLAFG